MVEIYMTGKCWKNIYDININQKEARDYIKTKKCRFQNKKSAGEKGG
jgi:hypothetical protein